MGMRIPAGGDPGMIMCLVPRATRSLLDAIFLHRTRRKRLALLGRPYLLDEVMSRDEARRCPLAGCPRFACWIGVHLGNRSQYALSSLEGVGGTHEVNTFES